MQRLFDLTGKTAIITGGTGIIGRHLAYGLAEHGANIIIFDKNLEDTPAILNTIRSFEVIADAIQVDITQYSEVEKYVDQVKNRFQNIDILINHAGLNIRKPAETFTENDWNSIMDLNLKALFFVTQVVGKIMINQRFGKIINTASVSARRGHPNMAIYAGSKGGVIQITKTFAREWAKYNINVNAVGPGYIPTSQTATLMEDPKRFKELVSLVPMGRLGKPDDLVGAYIFLSSSASDYITGTTIYVDGGRLID